ncbi:MAG: hypothetical protein LBN00_12160 [Oscillospiraceae bacterium]|nr:hypothetical protein [Oscillospiraceae bacterium]
MNIYDFIKSKAVAEHCVKIGHEFSPMDKMSLIAHGGNAQTSTFERRIALYRELAAECAGVYAKPYRGADEGAVDFPQFIEAVITNTVNAVEAAKIGGADCVFTLTESWNGNLFGVYKTFEDALAFFPSKYDYERYCISRYNLDRHKSENAVSVNRAGGITGMLDFIGQPEHPSELLYEDIYIPVPVPFVRGDIITDGDAIGIFDHLDGEDEISDDKYAMFFSVSAYCHTIGNQGLTYDLLDPLTNLEYYTDELPDELKPLKILSEYLRNQL